MNSRLAITLLGAFLIGTVMLNGDALAQGRGGGGGPGGGGGGDVTTPDYGDLIILYRDDWGVPVLDANSCQQPIGFPGNNIDCPIPEGCGGADPCLVPLMETDPPTCAIEPNFAACTDEADFGRTNTARSSDAVLESQLEDVIIGLAIADCTTLDPAGRMVHSRVDDLLVTTTIDSPLQNLAVYNQLMREGTIGVPLPQGADPLQTAARGLGVAMDKAGEVNVDLLVYLNEILGLTDLDTPTVLGKICIQVREEVMGSVELVQKCFLNYGPHEDFPGYSYNRATNFSTLPSPAYIPEGEGAIDGWFEFLYKLGENTYTVAEGPILETVFADGEGSFEPGDTDGNIGGFAQAADDTRAVINFMHNWPVPADGETVIPCVATPDPTLHYDLSISEQSGLKVPKQVVATTEGRELVVTISNAGPDMAAGTITVTANTDAGGDVLIDGAPGPFVFEFSDVWGGTTYTTPTYMFTIAEPHFSAKITWTAVVEPAAGDEDPYMGNNVVTATSNVRASGGGGH